MPHTKYEIPTRLNGFWSGVARMKLTISPFSIQAETIEKGGGLEVIPTNGRMLSCRSHFHATTSFAKR
jgi:hypothetical protein